jgi:predicted ester cyclase
MSEQNKQQVRRYYEEVLNGRNLDAVERYFVDERLIAGIRAGCFKYFQAFPDLHCSIEELVAEGDTVFCRAVNTGTHDGEYKGIEATGRNIAFESAELYRVADGRFVGYWCQSDVAGITRQLTEAREQAAVAAES